MAAVKPPLFLPLIVACSAPVEGDVVRMARLTPTQWENATVELLALDAPSGLSERFVSDPATGLFDNNADQLVVSPTLWQQQQDAAVALAEGTVADPDGYRRVVGRELDAAGDAKDRAAWLGAFGRRAFRRPLTVRELDDYTTLFDAGAQAFPNLDPFPAGVRVSIVGFLQSPHFVYRVERSIEDTDRLGPFSFASRLSFALWNGPPDDALLDRAESARSAGALLDSVPRMLKDDRARAVVRDLHRQILEVDSYASIPREFVSYEDYQATLSAAMQAEVDAFVEEVVYTDGTVADLFTSRLTFVDSRVAEVYGVEGVEREGSGVLEPVELDPGERAGLLTLSGFLAVHSSGSSENLIRRSAFVHQALLCTMLPPPPDRPSPSGPPSPSSYPQTRRERIEEATGECGGACHADVLNPIAFAFGQYDGRGRYRGRDVIDTTATYAFDGEPVTFDGAVELAELMAEEPVVHRCYASHLLSYLEGRELTSGDNDRVDELGAASLAGEPILGLMAAIVEHEDFRAVK